MGKLIKCRTCGQQIAKGANICPHCGAKNKKGGGCCSGVLLLFIMLGVIFYCVASGLSAPSSVNIVEPAGVSISMPAGDSAGGRQTGKPYDENTCVFYAKKYAEKRLDVKTKLEWVGNASVEKLPRKNFYAVEHDFTVLNAYNVEIKHRARISMEFNPDRGYRGVWLTVDGKTI
jgi:hypothetical protein